MFDFEFVKEKCTFKNIFEEEGAKIANVHVVINGWAARVHGNDFQINGYEEFFFTGEGVVEIY